jgi:hypothetical protein
VTSVSGCRSCCCCRNTLRRGELWPLLWPDRGSRTFTGIVLNCEGLCDVLLHQMLEGSLASQFFICPTNNSLALSCACLIFWPVLFSG